MANNESGSLFSRPRTITIAPARVYVYLVNGEELTFVDRRLGVRTLPTFTETLVYVSDHGDQLVLFYVLSW